MSPPHSNLSILFISNRVVLQFMATYYVQLASHKFIRLVHIIYFDTHSLFPIFSKYLFYILSFDVIFEEDRFSQQFGVFNEFRLCHIQYKGVFAGYVSYLSLLNS